jgi:hypothetical protein
MKKSFGDYIWRKPSNTIYITPIINYLIGSRFALIYIVNAVKANNNNIYQMKFNEAELLDAGIMSQG